MNVLEMYADSTRTTSAQRLTFVDEEEAKKLEALNE
jgi:hypothetical protein